MNYEIIKIENVDNYMLHLAYAKDDSITPRNVYFKNWLGWSLPRQCPICRLRDYVFSLMELPPHHDIWLFGGAFKILERNIDYYVLEEMEGYREFAGRLNVSYHKSQAMRGRVFYLENFINEFNLVDVLPTLYSEPLSVLH